MLFLGIFPDEKLYTEDHYGIRWTYTSDHGIKELILVMLLAKFYIRVITDDLLTSLSFFRGGTG